MFGKNSFGTAAFCVCRIENKVQPFKVKLTFSSLHSKTRQLILGMIDNFWLLLQKIQCLSTSAGVLLWPALARLSDIGAARCAFWRKIGAPFD